MLRDLGASFSYFSILPVRSSTEGYTDGAIAFLPVVGLVIGGLSGLAAFGVSLFTHGPLAPAITAWVFSIVLSGAIHVDGFLDCCDGLLAMVSPIERLRIMRDPHHGTYAIVGMAIASVLWLFALAHISAHALPLVLAFTGAASRWAAVRTHLWIGIILGMLFGLVIGIWVSLGFLVGLIVAILIEVFARSRLNGARSGDCYGAAIVVVEIALLMISAVSTSLGPGLFI